MPHRNHPKIRLRSLILLLLIIAFVVSGMYGFGTNLPETHIVTRKTVYHQPVDTVWEALTNYKTLPEWSPVISKVEPVKDSQKPRWRVYDVQGRVMEIEVVSEEENIKHVSRIVDGDFPFHGSWTFELQESGEHTLVVLTEEGRIDNPMWRVIMRYMLGKDNMVKQYLQSLGKKFGEEPHIIPG
jgi:uncharacterized membrane protein